MPVFVDAKNQDAPGGESFPLSLGESIKTGFEEAAISGPFFGGLLANDIRIANKQGTLLTQAEAKAQAAAEGFPGLSIPSAGMTDQGLETMLALARDRAEGEERLSRASGVGAFVGSLAGSMDPVLGPLNFVPVVGASREAAILAKASIKAGAAGRILARGAIGAIEGAVGSVPSMALNAVTRQAVGDDYTVDDAFAEFTSSVVMGAGFQAGIGQIGEGVSALADRSSHSWVREKFGTKSQEWRQLMEHDKRTADAIAADHAQPVEVEPVAQVAPVEPSPPPGVAPAPVKGRRGWNESPFKRDRLEVSSGLRDALGDRVIVREARAKTDPLATEIFEAMRKNEGEITKTPEAIAPLANAADAVADARRMGFTFDEALEYAPAYIGSDLDKMAARAQNLTFQEKEAARALIALEGQPERMARFVEEFQREQQKQGATRAVEAAIALISTPKGPAEKGRLASPQTITNAEAIADFQARSGIVINPEKVVDADPRIDQADPDAPAREVARADDPANRYDADELRQGRDKAKESEDLPDDEDYDALADEAEAELERLRKLTETEGARFAEGAALPESIDIGGVQRSTKDSTGRRLGRTEEEVRNFWAWFGDSKVVDEAGNPLVVYHGTNAGGEVFSVFKNPKAEDLGGDWNMFSESPQYSSQFAQAQGAHMLPVALSIQNPLDLSSLPPRRGDARNELISKLRSLDFDVDGLHRSIPYERDLYQIINRKGFREDLVSASKDKGYDGIKMPDSFDENGEDIISVTWIPFSPKQIKSATGNRGTFDPTNPDIRFAESDLSGVQSPAEAVRAEISERFGEDLVKLGESNGLTIVNSWQDIPGAPRESVIGMTEGGKVWIAASGLGKGQAASVYLHEMGAHVGIRKMVGDQGFADLQTRAGAILDSSPELAAVVRGAIPRDTDPRFRAEEELAYLVQHFEEGLSARADWWPSGAQWARITDPDVRRAVVEFVRDLLAKAKAWLYENAPALRGLPLDERDLHAMAVRSLRSAGEIESGRRFAQKASEADSEIEAAKGLSKRVREVYKKAYDKVAAAPELADDALVLAARSAGLEKAEAAELVKRFRKMGNAEAALKEDMTTAALVRYRATLNAIKLHEGMAQIMRFKGNETEGALSLDAGSEWNVAGARARNVDSARNKWTNELAGGAEWELRQAKLFELAKDPAHGTHIVNALFDIQMDRKDGVGVKYNADHAKIAEIMNRFQMSSLKRLRRMGVDIGQIKGRMLHQMHDSWALRNFANGGRTGATRAGIRGLVSRVLPGKWAPIGSDVHMNAWIDFVAPLLDAETYDGRVVDRDYLEGSYKLLVGFKEPSKDRELLSGRYSTGGVPGEAARLSSLGRNMKFKGPDEWAAYQKRCGNPDLLANFFGEQQATARSLAILEIYGPGGENTRAVLHQAVGQQLVGKPAMDWQNSRKKREAQWAVVSGKINIPGNEILANVYDNAANLTRASILGGTVLSQAPDTVNAAKWRALRFNKGASGVYTESATHIQDFARAAAKSPKVQQVLESYRADMDATIGGLLREIENGDSKGLTANIVSKVYDYQGATWLNRNNKHASVLGLSNWLASESRHGFDAIEPTTRDMLLQQGVEAPEWELIRLAEQVADDGRSYLTPEGLASVPEAKIAAHLESTGRKATPKTIEQWRDDTRIKLVGMMADEVSKSVIEPTARQRLTATGGLSKGTWSGTMVRAMWMCKSFAISQFQRGWMSEVRGRSSDPRARVQAGSGSHYLAIANYIAALTGMGFVSYMLKGWATGVQRKGIIENEDEDDKVLFFDIPVIDDRVLFASMNQGGGLGIYGDFLFADADRYGGGFMQTLSGPLLGKVEDAYKLWSAAKGADEEDAGKLANQAVRMLKGATPFGNLWWSRHVMDRLLWWNIQESINPAGLQRLEDAAEKRGDTYIFTKPSAALN